ncbi:hypothetical protein V2J09_001356 [Rumex salicifolius]
MIKLFTFLAKVKHIWSLWNLRGFMVFSFSLQCILIIGSSLRVQTAKSWVHRLIWLVYLLADWAAYYAIGLVVPIDRLQDQLDTYDIHSFWAPFLLLHIGGPNTIAGFSLEDNELWDRSVLHIIVQAGATVISIYRSLSKKRLLAPTLLVLVAALTRYAGRILALNKGSMDVLRREKVASKAPNKGKPVAPNKGKPGVLPITNFIIKEAKPSVMIVGVEPVKLAAHSYDLFRKYKGILCGLAIKDDGEAYKDRMTLFSRKPDQALVEMEMEISLAYDLFYTKIWTIVENETGKILHIISLVSEVGALVLWALANKQGYHKVDIKLTNALLVGGLFLDVVSLLKLVFSDLAICHLIKWKPDSSLVTCAMNQLLLVRNRAARWVLFRRWSGSIKQFDLMRYKGNDCCGSRGLGEWMTRTFGIEWGVSEVKLSDDLKNHIFKNIRIRGLYSGSKNGNVGKKTSIELGEYVLDMWDPNEPIANAIQHIYRRLGVVHTLIVWHTATRWFCANKPRNKLSQFNELLSKYMMYLLFYHSKMILEGAQLEMSVEDMTQKLIEIKNEGNKEKLDPYPEEALKKQLNSSSPSTNYGDISNMYNLWTYNRTQEEEALKKQEKDLDGILKKGENDDGEVKLIKKLASHIQKKLESADNPQEIMNEMWIDYLLYVAIRCRGRMHVQQLGNGGELLTLVWLMMTHLRLTIELPRPHGKPTKKDEQEMREDDLCTLVDLNNVASLNQTESYCLNFKISKMSIIILLKTHSLTFPCQSFSSVLFTFFYQIKDVFSFIVENNV